VQDKKNGQYQKTLNTPDGDMVENAFLISQTLIERSSFTSTTDQAGLSRRPPEINLQNHAVKFLQRRYHQTMTTNDENHFC